MSTTTYDWTKTNSQLAAEHGVSRQAIAQRRQRAQTDHDASSRRQPGRPTKKPATVDWTQPMEAVMAQHGISRPTYYLWRRQEQGDSQRGRKKKAVA